MFVLYDMCSPLGSKGSDSRGAVVCRGCPENLENGQVKYESGQPRNLAEQASRK